jgi:7,8-dihydropterin-6-yl-methyl-4-(beta-D-ribofuranosyl)aminobenzene 5'-phosphate synthase
LGSEHGSACILKTEAKDFVRHGAGALFIEKAEKLGVQICDIDLAVISHGHYDHGGGLEAFFKKNKKAAVYYS